jgi:Endonuclease I/Secretion system C-terminal sorting domain
MKKVLHVVAIILTCAGIANAQAVLPTSWNFDDATPAGWSESLNSGNTRYAGGFTGQACRLDGTTDYVLVEFAEEPGALTYYIKGQNLGENWQGTFTVEESANGSTFTALHTFVNADLPFASYTQYTDQPAATTRFIRFYFTNKVSGHNVALDEVALAQPTATTEQEINVTSSSVNLPSGYTYSIGNTSTTTFDIENLGSANDLTISSIELSGANADQFLLANIPTTVGAGSSESFDLTFTPVGDGSRFCTITINNDDTSEGTYVINVYAIAGSFASEPTAQATDLWFPGLNAWNFNVNFDAADPAAENYIVFRKKGSAVTQSPVDGTSYKKGQWVGGEQVVYVGPAGEFDARYIETSTSYHFAVFAFNGPEGFENYLTTSPLTGVATTDGPEIGTTYATLDHTEPTFVDELTAVLNPANYFQIYYSNYLSTCINEFYVRDTLLDGMSQNFIECQYSGYDYVYPAGFQWWSGGGPELSREHTFPQSWMPTYLDAGFDDSYEVSDMHNLMPVQQEACNEIRSNYPYGEVVTPSYTYLGTQFGDNADGQEVYEPRDEIKGDAARNMMYHAVKNNTPDNDFSFPESIGFLVPYGQQEYVVKQWHFNDLPNNFERARNEYLFSEQHNRNPFVDSVDYPCYIRFSNLTRWEPLFTTNNNVLTCIDPGLSYQWFKDGVEINGATNSTYTINQTGNYAVAVQQFSQCPEITGAASSVTYVDIAELNNLQIGFNVYPNPSSGEVTLNISSNIGASAEVKILDATGKVVYFSNEVLRSGTTQIPVTHKLSAGIYMVELYSQGGMLTSKLIVE